MVYDPSISRNQRARADVFPEETAYEAGRQEYGVRPDERGRSAADLLRQLLSDVTVLLRKELALAGSELGRSIDAAKHGVVSMATGGAVVYAGVLFLLGGVTLWLATMMPAWGAALLVGAVVTIIGLIMLVTGKKHVASSAFTPEHTVNALRKDKDALKRQLP